MEHFKRLAFCMLYLFTFIWQLSAQVKKIPQWGAVRDSVARYCQRNFISDVVGDNINKKPLLLQWFFSCRNEATRTPDPYVPNVVRYQLRYIPIPFSKSGATRNRTGDTRIFSPLLYQLSYGTIVSFNLLNYSYLASLPSLLCLSFHCWFTSGFTQVVKLIISCISL